MQQGGIQVDLALIRAAAEEVDRAAAADHVDGPLPRLRLAHRFDRHVHAAPVGHGADRFHRVAVLAGQEQVVGAQRGRAIQLRLPAAHRNHAAAVELRQFDEHQSDRTQSDNRHRIARARSRFLKPAHHARQRLYQRRVLIAHFFGNQVRVALHDARRDAYVLAHTRRC